MKTFLTIIACFLLINFDLEAKPKKPHFAKFTGKKKMRDHYFVPRVLWSIDKKYTS